MEGTAMDTLRISATARGLNYLPEYFADDTGLFEARGLKVQSEPKDPWTGVLDDLESGAADVALGGLWVPAMLAGTRDVVIVGQLNARFPMAVVTREPVAEFDWHWMSGKTVLVPGAGGTAPYEFTAGLIREAGLSPTNTRFVRDLSTDLLRELFEGGLGDAMVADLTTATRMQHEGHGSMSCQMAEVGGTMPNSVYYVRRDRLEELRGGLVAFMAAIAEAMRRLPSAEPAQIAALTAAIWPDADPAVLADAAGRLGANGTWEGIRIDHAASDRWTGILFDAGLLSAPVAYADIADDSIVDAAGQ
jgi:NitT/TauT family transport system substrate-binding protein